VVAIFKPVSGIVPQFSVDGNTIAAGYFLKGYTTGTTTPLSMATDDTAGTLLAKAKLNTQGYPLSNDADDTSVFIPYMNAKYKLALYRNATDADNNTTANADWVVDTITVNNDVSGLIYNQGGTGAVDRTQESKNQEQVSVKDFGATGDGSTDDTAAIQATEDALTTSGGTLFYPAGTYMISQVIKKPNTRWSGASRTSAIIKKLPDDIAQNMIDFQGTASLDNVEFSNLGFDGNISGPSFFDTRLSSYRTQRYRQRIKKLCYG